jgi:hypothetical protein
LPIIYRKVRFQGFDLLAQAVKDREAAGDRQDLIDLGQHALQLVLRQLAKSLDAETHTGMPDHDILHTEHIGGVLTDQVRALAQQISHGSLSFRIAISFGQYAQA